MHTNFADWYRVASIDPEKIPLALRWKGVQAFANDVDRETALDVVRILFNKQPKNNSFGEVLRKPFKNIDDAFPMRGNDLEMEVLSCAIITHLLESAKNEIADVLALAVICADFQGFRKRPILSEVIDLSDAFLYSRSNKLRTKLRPPKVTASTSTLTDLISEVKDATPATIPASITTITPVLEEIQRLTGILVRSTNTALGELSKQLRLQQEESNILWWLFAEHSRDRKVRMSELGHPAASIIAGKELADLTLTMPGPVAAEAFLDRMLQPLTKSRKSSKTSIREAIAAPKLEDWKVQELKNINLTNIDDLCTVHYALQQSIEVDDAGWVSAFENRSGITADTIISLLGLAMQVYREGLLIKAMK